MNLKKKICSRSHYGIELIASWDLEQIISHDLDKYTVQFNNLRLSFVLVH